MESIQFKCTEIARIDWLTLRIIRACSLFKPGKAQIKLFILLISFIFQICNQLECIDQPAHLTTGPTKISNSK